MAADTERRGPAIAEQLGSFFAALEVAAVPSRALEVARLDALDVAGLCVAARGESYVTTLAAGWGSKGDCTALGHAAPLDAPGAAVVNGTAAHGEDYDDTLEGSPLHVGAVVVPAVLAACEMDGRSGADALRGIVAGLETACRMNRVAPGGMHKACFHPTAVIAAFGASMGAGVSLGLGAGQLTNALGITGSLASGIIEYLTDGAWTKRLHAGWAAQSGLRAAMLARAGFNGPATVFEGEHNVFRAFAPSVPHVLDDFLDGLGESWAMERIAFKPYPCGTMIHPFIDCMLALRAQGLRPERIASIECTTAQAILHRLWEPLDAKQRPANGYAVKFSVPFCLALALVEGEVGFAQFTDAGSQREDLREIAAKVTYSVDPDNPYPRSYTGHVRVTLTDGSVMEQRQPHFRGGVAEPLSTDEIVAKFDANVRYGGWDAASGERLRELCLNLDACEDLSTLSAFRG